jgi:hypothetical protein
MIKFTKTIVFIVCIVIVFILTSAVLLRNRTTKESFTGEFPTIVCLMVTGKDEMRIHYAKHSVENFKTQTYPNKKLIIFNHHQDKKSVIKGTDTPDVHEFFIHKDRGMTLGTMRNMMLELVGYEDLWITWDDDDWRSPDLLAMMYRNMRKNNAVAVALTNRFEYNINQEFAWKSHLSKGFPHILAVYDRRARYLDKDTMEDVELIANYSKLGDVLRLDNAHGDYIRLVHGSNTSLFVNPDKRTTISNGNAYYSESQISKKERDNIVEIMSRYRNENTS